MRHSPMRVGISTLALAISLSGCASIQTAFKDMKSGSVTSPKQIQQANFMKEELAEFETLNEPAVYYPDEAMPNIIMPNIIMDGQMKPKPVDIEFFDKGPSMSGFQAVSYAHNAATVKPTTDNYLNAIQLYPYTPGSLYQVYTSPKQVTDIALEKGEGLITVSAGDTDRWTVGDTVSGSGVNEQVHILVKPMAANLSTNAIITSTKRTYYLDFKSFAKTYMAAVSWRYPHDAIKQARKPKAKTSYIKKTSFTTADLKLKPEDLRFDYVIKGDSPDWRPTRVFDDGKKTFIQFPKSLAVSEAPPLFVTDRKGKKSKLVNYRVKGEYYVVDRLFNAAELRLGEKDQIVVRIERQS